MIKGTNKKIRIIKQKENSNRNSEIESDQNEDIQVVPIDSLGSKSNEEIIAVLSSISDQIKDDSKIFVLNLDSKNKIEKMKSELLKNHDELILSNQIRNHSESVIIQNNWLN